MSEITLDILLDQHSEESKMGDLFMLSYSFEKLKTILHLLVKAQKQTQTDMKEVRSKFEIIDL
jgi:hypothetical protein